MKKLNWKIILPNIKEAREELAELESQIASTKKPVEVELELSLRHTYHHLNTAWNVRHTATKRYRNLTRSDFKKWGRFPKGFDGLETYGEEN
ncbi:MAG TPA: hypothetical protein VLZ10_02630 [Thermodesulfobacteriota bacterium]|nr:hypothetical protein [Thermodesulfobacteriota bacterium]